MRRHRLLLFSICVAVGLAAVGVYALNQGEPPGLQHQQPDTFPDPWCRLVSEEFMQAPDVRPLDRAMFTVVTGNEPDALARLEQAPCIEISPQEANQYIGGQLAGIEGRLVLLRGLAFDAPYGAFTIQRRPGAVRINYGCLGRSAPPVVRRALVARLPDLPKEVFVDLCIAQ